ncbi:hypothetical protein ACLOJK_004988 [Asimina triloba]
MADHSHPTAAASIHILGSIFFSKRSNRGHARSPPPVITMDESIMIHQWLDPDISVVPPGSNERPNPIWANPYLRINWITSNKQRIAMESYFNETRCRSSN